MTSQQLIFKLSNLNIKAKRFVQYFIVKLQLTVVLTVRTVTGRFLAYITYSIQRKRCDEPLLNLAPYRGLWFQSILRHSGDHNSVKKSPIVMTVCVCLLLGNPEVQTKFQLSSLIFFLFKNFDIYTMLESCVKVSPSQFKS